MGRCRDRAGMGDECGTGCSDGVRRIDEGRHWGTGRGWAVAGSDVAHGLLAVAGGSTESVSAFVSVRRRG